MKRRNRDHSIDAEPHLNESSFQQDPSEAAAAKKLHLENQHRDAGEELARHSIFDEPAVLPNRSPVLIDQDWICTACGYNLRGLTTGQRCPECGGIERYEPPRAGEVGYAAWVAEHASERSTLASRVKLAGMVVAACIPLSVAAAFASVDFTGPLSFIVFGPFVIEALRLCPVWVLVERFPHRVSGRGQLWAFSVVAAVLFATVQNVVYLTLFFSGSPVELIFFRWTVGVAAHVICAALATRGTVAVWETWRVDGRLPVMSKAYYGLGAAIAVHAIANACVFSTGHLGYGF